MRNIHLFIYKMKKKKKNIINNNVILFWENYFSSMYFFFFCSMRFDGILSCSEFLSDDFDRFFFSSFLLLKLPCIFSSQRGWLDRYLFILLYCIGKDVKNWWDWFLTFCDFFLTFIILFATLFKNQNKKKNHNSFKSIEP